MIDTWEDMDFWRSGEWQVIQEKLDALDSGNIKYNPNRSDLFNPLDDVAYNKVAVCILGQDPYPSAGYCTGHAFSIPNSLTPFPSSLVNIFKEYSADLHLPTPTTGSLKKWIDQGVLLWNASPSYLETETRWVEWEVLTQEIVERLEEKSDVVFVFLGKHAQAFATYAPLSDCILSSHPSPLGVNKGNDRKGIASFNGSRIFSTVNQYLNENSRAVIDWRLEDGAV